MAARQNSKLLNFELINEVKKTSEFVLVSLVEGSNFGGLTLMTQKRMSKLVNWDALALWAGAGLVCTTVH